jgi:hypothetical protein
MSAVSSPETPAFIGVFERLHRVLFKSVHAVSLVNHWLDLRHVGGFINIFGGTLGGLTMSSFALRVSAPVSIRSSYRTKLDIKGAAKIAIADHAEVERDTVTPQWRRAASSAFLVYPKANEARLAEAI